uniref:Protein kinase domain-containing protein n=1 Tax=Zea mays TaxID=4577 RepID=B4FRB6_MAIZE|nr:unknown [Zea mays]|eukprot:NP_001140803.1 putative protein kinase superfamily protein [Zea mays]
MDVAVALSLLFCCVLLLASGAIAFLLIRHFLASGAEARAAAPRHRQPPPAANQQQQRAASIAVKKEEEEAPRRLAWREVEALTGGFDESAVVGRGGSSAVYLARLLDGSPVAVKVHRWCGGERRLRAFRQELDLLRRLRHPNIVALLAYSDDHEEEGALVLEYLAGGTLADALHGTSTAVVHGDVSASNVLLFDGGARLCDLGSACEGFSAAVAPARAAVGSPGYADPFFLRTGIVSTKSDVYGFGVLLLEAVTGLPPASEAQNLTARILPRVRERGVAGLVDGRLGDGGLDEEEAASVAELAVECLAAQPGLRPSMAQVRAAIAEKAARSIAKAGYGHHIQLSKLLELT